MLRSIIIIHIVLVFIYLIGTKALDEVSPPLFRNDYNYSKEYKLYYKEHKVSKNWADALFTCKSEGASLFIPKSAEQILNLMDTITEGTNEIWIGITDQYAEGVFVTINGESIDAIYNNWKQSEPNNKGDNENCVAMDKGGLYYDNNCNKKIRFLCEKPIDELKNFNTKCKTYDSGFVYSSKLNHCYKFHEKPMTWNRSYQICFGEESRLAIINSQDEADFFIKLFEKHPEDSLEGNFNKNLIHIGFSDIVSPGMRITNDGQDLSDAGYDKWAPEQPYNSEHCGSMLRNGLLSNVNCFTAAMFICEKHLN